MKLKKVIMSMVLAFVAFAIVGLGQVKAIRNYKVVCDGELEIGTNGHCYLIALMENDESVHGIIAATVVEDLKIVGSNSGNSTTVAPSGATIDGNKVKGTEFVCNTQIVGTSAGNIVMNTPGTKACYGFISKTDEPAIKKGYDSTMQAAAPAATKGDPGYTILADFTVALSDDLANSNSSIEKCGKLCISAQSFANKSQYTMTGAGTGTVCDEINLRVEGTPNPPTGSFVSYIVLVAGALIAIAAIAIAKKRNKFYRV
jgi:hypothetical protein